VSIDLPAVRLAVDDPRITGINAMLQTRLSAADEIIILIFLACTYMCIVTDSDRKKCRKRLNCLGFAVLHSQLTRAKIRNNIYSSGVKGCTKNLLLLLYS